MPSIRNTLEGRQFFEMAFVRVSIIMICYIVILIHSNECHLYSRVIIRELEAPNNKCS